MLEIAWSFPFKIEIKGFGIGNASKINRIIISEPIGIDSEERHLLDDKAKQKFLSSVAKQSQAAVSGGT
jgi:hypothetical protein